jgi:predicted Ser/Thr protein kinase
MLAIRPTQDSVVYACRCAKLGGRSVVLKVYDKGRMSPVKHRSVRREARIMKFLTYKG